MHEQGESRKTSRAAGGSASGLGPQQVDASPARILSPIDRLTELLYGIVLVLTFTGTLRVAAQGRDDVYSTLWAAVGCSVAWGVVDACMYVLGSLTSRNRGYQLVRTLRDDPETGRQRVADAMPTVVADVLTREDWDRVFASLAGRPVPRRARVTRDDVAGGAAIFMLANAALLPLAVPFAIIDDLALAQHVSNGLALAMLFACGFSLARYTGQWPLGLALAFTVFGCVLVAVTIALGG